MPCMIKIMLVALPIIHGMISYDYINATLQMSIQFTSNSVILKIDFFSLIQQSGTQSLECSFFIIRIYKYRDIMPAAPI